MARFSQDEIDQMIQCPKKVTSPPSRDFVVDGAHLRQDAKLVATDGTESVFFVFVRKSIYFPENFSVGLVYSSKDGRPDITLIRCNGPHGAFNSGSGHDAAHPHFHTHIHRATEAALESGERAEKYAETTTAFATAEEAVRYFLREVNVEASEISKYFPYERQLPLLGDEK